MPRCPPGARRPRARRHRVYCLGTPLFEGSDIPAGQRGAFDSMAIRDRRCSAPLLGRQGIWIVATRAAASVPFGAVSQLLPPGADTTAGGFGAWRAATEHVAQLAAKAPVALGVDDAHLLDDESAAFLHHLAARGLVSLVATVRSGAEAPDAIVALWKDDLVQRLNLRPLARPAVDELIGHVLDAHVAGVTQRDIHRLTVGGAAA